MSRRYVVLALTSILAISLAVPALGGPSNPVAEGAASAKKTAKKALKKAKKAQQTANAAQLSADDAAADAAAAQTAAANAQSTADGAQTSANGAQASADTAQASADNAQATADAAQTSANNAQATANAAFSTDNYEEGTQTATDSNSPKLASASCGGGETPVSGGWTILGAGSDDVLINITTQYGTGWLIQASEVDPGTGDTWAIAANVVCLT